VTKRDNRTLFSAEQQTRGNLRVTRGLERDTAGGALSRRHSRQRGTHRARHKATWAETTRRKARAERRCAPSFSLPRVCTAISCRETSAIHFLPFSPPSLSRSCSALVLISGLWWPCITNVPGSSPFSRVHLVRVAGVSMTLRHRAPLRAAQTWDSPCRDWQAKREGLLLRASSCAIPPLPARLLPSPAAPSRSTVHPLRFSAGLVRHRRAPCACCAGRRAGGAPAPSLAQQFLSDADLVGWAWDAALTCQAAHHFTSWGRTRLSGLHD